MMRKLRVRRGVLQTPVIRYRHRRTGRTVTLVGTAHVGEASYYDRLHAMVTRLEAAGAVVCYEWIGPAAEEEWAVASAGERAARDVHELWGRQLYGGYAGAWDGRSRAPSSGGLRRGAMWT